MLDLGLEGFERTNFVRRGETNTRVLACSREEPPIALHEGGFFVRLTSPSLRLMVMVVVAY